MFQPNAFQQNAFQDGKLVYPFDVGVKEVFTQTPTSMFANSEHGGQYDFSDLTTLFQDSAGTTPVAADGDPIGKVTDKSGNGVHLLQATAGFRPVWKTGGYAQFDGVDDCLQSAVLAWDVPQPATFAVAFKSDTTVGTRTVFEAGIGNTNRYLLQQATGDLIIYSGNVVTVSSPETTAFSTAVVSMNGAATVARVNGVEVTVNPGTGYPHSGGIVQLGRQSEAGRGFWSGRVYAALLSGKELNATGRALLETFYISGAVGDVSSGSATAAATGAETTAASDTQSETMTTGELAGAESTSISDAVSATTLLSVDGSEATSISDTETADMTASVTASEATSPSDTQSAAATMTVTVSEAGSASDASTAAATFSLTVAELANASELAEAAMTALVQITEGASAADVQSLTASLTAAIAEATAGADTSSVTASFTLAGSEAADARDSVDASLTITVSVSEVGAASAVQVAIVVAFTASRMMLVL